MTIELTDAGRNEYEALVRDAKRYRALGVELNVLLAKISSVSNDVNDGRMSPDIGIHHITYHATRVSMSPAVFLASEAEAVK